MESNDFDENIIKNFLEKLKESVDVKKINIIDILKKSSTKRYEYFNELKLAESDLNPTDIIVLSRENLIYKKENEGYIITLKTLILMKYDSMNEFLNDLNKQFLIEIYKKNALELSWDEKTIILTLLGLMACDKKSAFKFETDKNADMFQTCAEDAMKFLQENNIIDIQYTVDKLFNYNARGEHKVQAKMSRINDIVIKSSGVYQKDSRDGHYLNIIINNDINITNLYLILRLVFPSLPNKQELIELLKRINSRRYEILSDVSDIPLSLKQKLYDSIRMWTIN
ncbi:hypothetical protein DMB44_09035 [Thermoplasma sp. Kam2015]|uniref:hypothetical protein n=1 Tax=Thermoplasma sp. Kam2015 TaxID=2094122 RepID=UPI000D9A30C7|nr:hypothetical protein [Thermoplasma sp. Kam2015]PYB67466.1 hypothetical protein DMB44_09035 [Thermoplasma sp. Kam2015]